MELHDALSILGKLVKDSPLTDALPDPRQSLQAVRDELTTLLAANETLRINVAGQEATIERLNNDLLTRYGEYYGRSKVLHKIMHLAINELGYELETED